MALLQNNLVPVSAEYEIEQSLRFNDDDSAYLSWTPTSAGNRKTWTFSTWIKKTAFTATSQYVVFSSTGIYDRIMFGSDDDGGNTIRCLLSGSTSDLVSKLKVRDSSAWYHLVVAVDTSQATASDRVNIYLNGEQITDFVTGQEVYPNQNSEGNINSTAEHNVGRSVTYTTHFDGYLAETHFIDGQALDPSNFGETGDYGEWKPIKYTGTYGSNGFYLKMKRDETVEGFNTIGYRGEGGSQSISGVGFTPDFVWFKRRDGIAEPQVHDSVRGVNYLLDTSGTGAELDRPTFVTSFDSDGFSFGDNVSNYNSSGGSYVAWCWDAGTGSASSNTDGTITSTVKANTAYGFSIANYTGNATDSTVGHGLDSAPEMIIIKKRGQTSNWAVNHKDLSSNDHYLILNSNSAEINTNAPWNNTAPTATVFSIDAGAGDVNTSGQEHIAYCFHSVAGYSKIGSYVGDGTTNHAITTGFKPAFVMIKASSTAGYNWFMYDNTRDTDATLDTALRANVSDAETTSGDFTFTDTGFTHNSTYLNASGVTFVYMAFADTREYKFWKDYSGNNNNWTPNNLTEYDEVKDSPTNNFPTFNPIDNARTYSGGIALKEGNLFQESTTDASVFGSMAMTSGKWYAEFLVVNSTNTRNIGIIDANESNGYIGHPTIASADSYAYRSSVGDLFTGTTTSATGVGTTTAGDIVSVAVDLDSGTKTIKWQKNGSDLTGTTQLTITQADIDWLFGIRSDGNQDFCANFGQDSSFAGNKPAQGNTDDKGYGDFYYAPPTGYLALCTQNLPDATVIPSEHFNTVIYSGNGYPNTGVTNVITGVGFQPDMTWLKERATTAYHHLFDVLRGSNKALFSNGTNAEYTNVDAFNSFDADGFTLGQDTNGDGVNRDATTYNTTVVAWNWKANGAGVSNTDGTITSTVSANTSAGFSIVSYTGNGTNGATVGHGLSKAPEMVIVKSRDIVAGWYIQHEGLSADMGDRTIFLEQNSAESTNSTHWNNTAPSSTVFTLGTSGGVNQNTKNHIAYAFHSVDGFSKVGSYTGNGSTDGTFVYTGFRPAYILWKAADTTHDWNINDNARTEGNVFDKVLYADLTNAEATSVRCDLVSNGFKIRASDNQSNANGNTYIYIAFAENPFKHTNAR